MGCAASGIHGLSSCPTWALAAPIHMGSQFPGQGSNPHLLHCKTCRIPSPSTATLATGGQEEHVLYRKITKGGSLQAGCLQRSLLAPTCNLCHHHQYRLLPSLNIPSGLRLLGSSQLITSPSFCFPCPVEEGCYWAGEAFMCSGHILGYLLWQSGLHQRSGLLLIRCLCK